MVVTELLGKACDWHQSAPARLRWKLPEVALPWDIYSTSRHVEGSESTLFCVIGFPEASGDPGISVELLPEHLAGKWAGTGFHFATEHDLHNLVFEEMLIQSLELARTVESIHGTITGMCRSLHVLVSDHEGFDVSFSEPSLPFSIFISCPGRTEPNPVERLTENIVHEALHLQLSLVERIVPLIDPIVPEETAFSPWKSERRPIRGLIHAVYVFGNLRRFWESVSMDKPEFLEFAQTRIESIGREMEDVRNVFTGQPLTSAGKRLVSSMLVPARTTDT